jgi:hypothetical protein
MEFGAWGVAVLAMKDQLVKEIEAMDYSFIDDGEETWHYFDDIIIGGYGIEANVVFGDGKLYITAYPSLNEDTIHCPLPLATVRRKHYRT